MTQLQTVARGLLEAWNCGDRTTLQRQLEYTAVVEPDANSPWVEYERGDLLAGIVQNMRKAFDRGPEYPLGCDIEVSVQLLHHLVADSQRVTGRLSGALMGNVVRCGSGDLKRAFSA